MITVSDAWKALHLGQLLPEAYVELSYYITEPGLVDDVTSSGTEEAVFSKADQIKDFSLRSEPMFATFEHNAWVLNGKYNFVPSVTPFTGDVGYVSDEPSAEGGWETVSGLVESEYPYTSVALSKTPIYITISPIIGEGSLVYDASVSTTSYIIDGYDWPIGEDEYVNNTGFCFHTGWGGTPEFAATIASEAGTFTANPLLTLQLGSVHATAVPGITITFAPDRGEWATEFIVRAYNGVTLLATETVTGNTEPILVVDITGIVSYDKVTVEIVKWSLPNRYARIMEIALGLKQVYTKAELFGYEHTSSGNLASAELPKNSIQFKLDNTDGRWNPSNPTGLEQYLIERQTISVRYGFKINGSIEWVKVGTFYMSEWDTPSNGLEATFTARDSLEFMGAIYNGTRSGTLAAIATAALTQAGISSTLYSLHANLSAITVNFTADTTVYTISDILQMCAHAAECVIHQTSTGVITIAPLNTVTSDYAITQFNSFTFPEYTLSKELKSVSVNSDLGTAVNGVTGEILTSDNPLIETEAIANAVAAWLVGIYGDRRVLKGSFRPDPRAEVYDKITVTSKYATDVIYLTQIKYTFNGAFRGEYEGRVMA